MKASNTTRPHPRDDELLGLGLPNLLSLARVPLAGLLWVAPNDHRWVFSVVAVAGVTDVLDGALARRYRRRRWAQADPGAFAAHVARGEVIDGFADKVFVASAVSALAWVRRADLGFLCLMLLRELLFVPLMVAFRIAPQALRSRVDFTASWPGKATTCAQFVALGLGFAGHGGFRWACVVAGGLGVLATLHYVGRTLNISTRGR